MKNLKLFQKMFLTAIILFVVSFLAGCSDQLTSLPESENVNSTGGNTTQGLITADENFSLDKFVRIQIKLKPYRSFTFSESNTGLDQFNSIDVENLSLDPNIDKYVTECQDIRVYGSTTIHSVLNCHSKGFILKEITVENTGAQMLDLDVALSGTKRKPDSH